MDPTQLISGLMSGLGTQGTQSTQGHHHHHKSMAQKVDSMETAIDDALKAGQLSNDQASAMKKELDDIKQTLAQAGQTTGTGATGQTDQTGQAGSLSQLSDADRKKIFSEMQDVRKQLFDALNPQAAVGTATTNQTDQMNKLFSAMDTNGDGSVSQNEFAAFLNSLAQNAQNTPDSMNMGYSQNGAMSMSIMQMSRINITA